MKKTLILIAACLFAFGGNAVAQKNIKLGHINSQELLQIMPGRDAAKDTLQKEASAMGDIALLILICAMGVYTFYDDLIK